MIECPSQGRPRFLLVRRVRVIFWILDIVSVWKTTGISGVQGHTAHICIRYRSCEGIARNEKRSSSDMQPGFFRGGVPYDSVPNKK